MNAKPETPRRRRLWSPGWVLWPLLLAACSGEGAREEQLEPAHDLVALLPVAEVLAEPGAITFGAPEERWHLRSGWSRLEHDRNRDRGFAWGVGEASVIDFHLLARRDLDLRLEGRPFAYPGASAQAVAISVNGSPVSEIELRPRLASYAVAVPREQVRAGANRLELVYRWSRSPRQVSGAGDRRSLAVAWYEIDFGGNQAGAPRAATGPSRLFLPIGSEVAFYLELAPGSRSRLAGWSRRGAPSSRLQVELTTEDEAEGWSSLVEGSEAMVAFDLTGDETRLARLALRALPAPEGTAAGGFELRAPAVWSPPAGEAPAAPEDPGTAARRPSAARPHAARPNIVLYLIDTLRADRLGCYGYPRPVSPRIDAFAEDAVLFERAVAQSSWTRSAMASVFTGKWPLAHGTNGRDDRLNDVATTLAERLRAAGYRTMARVTNPNVTPGFGFDQGFDDYSYLGETAGSDGVHRAAIEWLDDRSDDQPFLLYLHTLDPHAPYVAPDDFRRSLAPGSTAAAGERSLAVLDDLQAGRRQPDAGVVEELEALYDATIAFNDHSFGALLNALEARGLLDGALVILLSDHGEEFHEHGNWQHGHALHAESVDVPLIVKLPGADGRRRVTQPVRQVDLLPTILDLLELPPAAGVEGRSLLPLIDGTATDHPAPPAFSYLHLDGPARVSVEDRGWKLIQRYEHGRLIRPRLYRVAEDPGETRELSGRFPMRTGYLASLIRRKLAGERGSAEAAEVDDETRQALEALGYL